MTTLEELPLTPTTTTVRAACPHDCPDTCAMLVSVQDGRAMRESRAILITRSLAAGFASGSQQLSGEDLRADRVLHPMRRVGAKGERAVRADHVGPGAHRDRDRVPPPRRRAWRRDCDALQLPRQPGHHQRPQCRRPVLQPLGATVTERTYCDSGAHGLCDDHRPHARGRSRELVHARYIILWARNTLCTNSHLWPIIAQAQKTGPSRGDRSDADAHRRLADWHIPIRPGTDAALALAMIHVIIKGWSTRLYRQPHLGYDELAERVQRTRLSAPRRRPASRLKTSARWPASTRPRPS